MWLVLVHGYLTCCLAECLCRSWRAWTMQRCVICTRCGWQSNGRLLGAKTFQVGQRGDGDDGDFMSRSPGRSYVTSGRDSLYNPSCCVFAVNCRSGGSQGSATEAQGRRKVRGKGFKALQILGVDNLSD